MSVLEWNAAFYERRKIPASVRVKFIAPPILPLWAKLALKKRFTFLYKIAPEKDSARIRKSVHLRLSVCIDADSVEIFAVESCRCLIRQRGETSTHAVALLFFPS